MLDTRTSTETFARVPLADLRPGMLLRMAMYDGDHPRQPLLLAAGVILTKQTFEALRRRGVQNVKVHKSEINRLVRSNDLSKRLANLQKLEDSTEEVAHKPAETPTPTGWRVAKDSFLNQVQRRPDIRPTPEMERQFQGAFENSIGQVQEMFGALGSGQSVDSRSIDSVSHKQLDLISTDIDLTIEMGAEPVLDRYPSQHSLQTAMLASSMGTLMGLRSSELSELCSGCLVHDAGMMKVAERLRSTQNLGLDLKLEMMRHPIYIFDMLSNNPGIGHSTKMVAYQMHERMDGSGYPKQRTGSQIHPLARIAAVADTYLALVSPRPHRDGLAPYDAVKRLLEETQRGLYDPAAVRSLLHSVSLFPLGSLVELNNGCIAKVLRSNRDKYDRPMVEAQGDFPGIRNGEVFDLAQIPDLKIVKALTDVHAEWNSHGE